MATENEDVTVGTGGETLRMGAATASSAESFTLDDIVKDKAATSALPATQPPVQEAAAAAVADARDAATTVLGTPNLKDVWGMMPWAMHQLIHFFWDTWGNLLLVGGAIALVTWLIVHATHSGGITKNIMPPTNNTVGAAGLQSLNNKLDENTQVLIGLGASVPEMTVVKNQTLLVEGTQIALQHQAAAPLTVVDSQHQEILNPFGSTPPNHYATLQTLNTNLYLESLSEAPGRNALLKNSCAVHNLCTQAR